MIMCLKTHFNHHNRDQGGRIPPPWGLPPQNDPKSKKSYFTVFGLILPDGGQIPKKNVLNDRKQIFLAIWKFLAPYLFCTDPSPRRDQVQRVKMGKNGQKWPFLSTFLALEKAILGIGGVWAAQNDGNDITNSKKF